jgi:hypothetical protein
MSSLLRGLSGLTVPLIMAFTPALACREAPCRDLKAGQRAAVDRLIVRPDDQGFSITRLDPVALSLPEVVPTPATFIEIGASLRIDQSVFMSQPFQMIGTDNAHR